MIPLFKTRHSLNRSILDVSKKLETKPGHADNIINIAIDEELKEVAFVEDNMTAFLLIDEACRENHLTMRFALRVSFCSDAENPKKEEIHKNLIFLKKNGGYENLVKCATFGGNHLFDGDLLLDYNFFHKHREGLDLVVPFYDSYLYRNNTEFATCIPDFRDLAPLHLIERNGLPDDSFIEGLLKDKKTQLVKSIYYKDKKDVHAFATRKLMEKDGKRRSLEVPNLDGFGSNEFCVESWKEYNKR